MSDFSMYQPTATIQAAAVIPGSGLDAFNKTLGIEEQSTDSSTTTPDKLIGESDPRYKWKDLTTAALANRQDRIQQLTDDRLGMTTGIDLADRVYYSNNSMRADNEYDYDIAYIRVIAFQNGTIYTDKQIFPSTRDGNTIYNYKKFILQSYSVSMTERSQILKSNKALHAYFFNNSPEVLSMQGILKASEDDPWDQAMIIAWDKLLRATELARHRAIVEIGIAGTTFWGYPIAFGYGVQSNTQYLASFSMSMLIVDRSIDNYNIDGDVLTLQGNTTNTNSMVVIDSPVSGQTAPTLIKSYEDARSTPEYYNAADASAGLLP